MIVDVAKRFWSWQTFFSFFFGYGVNHQISVTVQVVYFVIDNEVNSLEIMEKLKKRVILLIQCRISIT